MFNYRSIMISLVGGRETDFVKMFQKTQHGKMCLKKQKRTISLSKIKNRPVLKNSWVSNCWLKLVVSKYFSSILSLFQIFKCNNSQGTYRPEWVEKSLKSSENHYWYWRTTYIGKMWQKTYHFKKEKLASLEQQQLGTVYKVKILCFELLYCP